MVGIRASLRAAYVPQPRMMTEDQQEDIAKKIDKMADAAKELHDSLQPTRSIDEALEQWIKDR